MAVECVSRQPAAGHPGGQVRRPRARCGTSLALAFWHPATLALPVPSQRPSRLCFQMSSALPTWRLCSRRRRRVEAGASQLCLCGAAAGPAAGAHHDGCKVKPLCSWLFVFLPEGTSKAGLRMHATWAHACKPLHDWCVVRSGTRGLRSVACFPSCCPAAIRGTSTARFRCAQATAAAPLAGGASPPFKDLSLAKLPTFRLPPPSTLQAGLQACYVQREPGEPYPAFLAKHPQLVVHNFEELAARLTD